MPAGGPPLSTMAAPTSVTFTFNVTFVLGQYTIDTFDSAQQASFLGTVVLLSPSILNVQILSITPGSVIVLAQVTASGDASALLSIFANEPLLSAKLGTSQVDAPPTSAAIQAAINQVAPDPCPEDCPSGLVFGDGSPVCGQCCSHPDQQCAAYFEPPNGCGSGSGFTTEVVHLLILLFGPAGVLDLFTPICNYHDICYSSPQYSQYFCDNQLLNQLTLACVLAYPNSIPSGTGACGGPTDPGIPQCPPPNSRQSCVADAFKVYYVLSSDGANQGSGPYEAAQNAELDYITTMCDELDGQTCIPHRCGQLVSCVWHIMWSLCTELLSNMCHCSWGPT